MKAQCLRPGVCLWGFVIVWAIFWHVNVFSCLCGVSKLEYLIGLAVSMYVWSLQDRGWMSLSALIGSAASSCQVGSSSNIRCVCVCVSSRHVSAMSRHRDRRGGSLCHQNVWGHAYPPVFLSLCPLSPSFSLLVEPRHSLTLFPCLSVFCLNWNETEMCRHSVSLSFSELMSMTESKRGESLFFLSFSFCYVSLSDKREMQQWAHSGPASREGVAEDRKTEPAWHRQTGR